MEARVESPGCGRAAGIAIEFPASDGTISSPMMMPPRLRRRLSETKASPSSVEEIEAKLRDADLRRQEFYEKLSSKARVKPRNLSKSSSQEDDIGQRLEAKLHAAEQKRLSMLAKSQMRLAKLDELRQSVKTGLEMRFKKECAELGTKVESRVQQAEVNRMLLLKSYKQRRAKLTERTSQSLSRRIARESKYKECVLAAICQKRAAAEKKRQGLLEADMKRAGARVLQVRKVVKSVSQQREIESRRLRDKLEDRLQRASRKRAEYLMQRARLHNSIQWNNMQKQADLLSRKIARCWRKFLEMRRTTLDLTKAYDALNINETRVKSAPFEQLSLLIESDSTLQTAKALLDRLESRYKLSQAVTSANSFSRSGDIDHLLKQVASPKKRALPRKPAQTSASKKPVPIRESSKSPVQLSRYQVRVVLCAYMILAHPDAVFSGHGERETSLAKSAEKFVREFELLTKIILDGPVHGSDEESEPALARRWTFRSQLAAFDAAWCSYLNSFVVWKVKDAESLEEDLVRAACQLELSMIQKCKLTPEGESEISDALTHDLKAIKKQVVEDQKLMKEKIMHLSGDAGIERMENSLSDTRMKYFQATESPVGSPLMHILPPSSSTFPARPTSMAESSEKPSSVVRSLFSYDASFLPTSVPISSLENLDMENELIVNEAVHEKDHTFADTINVTDEGQDGVKEKVRETLVNAFWDGITESMKQDEPKYDRIVELMREVRDEICEMAPQSWKQEITEAIDLDILSQVLNSGELDMDHLQRILEFALVTLQKLSAPANEDELKAAHQELLKELAEICQAGDGSNQSRVIALIKGLRFVLERIQVLKQEISKARIRIMEPILKGPAGMDYLEKAFAKRYGPPSDASAALPLTMRWLSSVWGSKDQEWGEHTNSLFELKSRQEGSSQRLLPSTTLRAGGSFFVKTSGSQLASFTSSDNKGADEQYSECKGEKVDLLVRLGVLKLVNGVSDLAQEPLPETLKLNVTRLRAVQAQLQKVIVIATSVLVLRQTLISEQMVGNTEDMEGIVLSCVNRLSELLDTVEDTGIKEIVEILAKFTKDCDKSVDTNKLQSRKDVMATMLKKSLQSEDAVFVRVARAVYLAARGFVLGGSAAHGRELTEMSLQQVGAAGLTNTVVEAAKTVVVAATVSFGVHGPWYAHLVENM